MDEQRTARGSLICLVNMVVGRLQFLRSALIGVAYEKVPTETFGQGSVFRASSFIVQASIRLPTTNRPFARTSRHFIVGVPSGNEITPCAADNSAVASRCDTRPQPLSHIELVCPRVFGFSDYLSGRETPPRGAR